MGKNDDDGLDRDSRKRLEQLAVNWSEPASAWRLKELTAADLRLLLEHFPPLRDLIRTITAAPAVLARQNTALPERIDEEKVARRAPEDVFARVQAELAEAQTQLRDLRADLAQCTAANKKRLQADGAQEQERQPVAEQLLQTQQDLSACRAQLARHSRVPEEVTLLRVDAELAQRLELAGLPADDSQALIRVVAVLAQRDNLERLWSALKERCETQRRPAPEPERALLSAALVWHNFNWRTRPYRLIEAESGTAYDYEHYLRSRHTSTGETVTELWLPGIAEGSGKPLCKALVSTR